ncbi:hypothetical protein QLS31_14550 [Flavobacterium sp. XS2P24]|uniref:hypothetical protein n=1 Tax=Flavobacterium sp. XS2P24 TaxID=3041249 RepID=UPI0024A7ED01|nr:hypothetical protein [Flavobacterium sp. XS2P24]MDI6051048.1 hypothetical protein [Flavobacterium sp. XS2P24]
MDEVHKARLLEVLKRNQLQLEGFLTDPRRDEKDLHYTIAGQLRVLLCDADVPVLLRYAAESNVALKVWAAYPAGFKYRTDKAIFSFNALIASYYPEYDAYEMSIEDFLDTEIGAVPKVDKISNIVSGTIAYTPRKLIKWISNKDGVTHLELSPMQSLETIKFAIEVEGNVDGFTQTDSLLIRSAIIQIGEWTNEAIKGLLTTIQNS